MAVAAGIMLSRIAGFVRERAIAHYLGQGAATGALRAATRIPNTLQNLFGEGVLSASFIPVYTRLRAEGKTEEAERVARAVGTLLALAASVIALLGVAFAGPLVDLLAPGFSGPTRDLTAQLVRIMFPGLALLVMSAWCLGVLNSHRRFFLPYASPVLWNAAQIAVAVAAGGWLATGDADVALWIAWGFVIGSAAQLLVQVPAVMRLVRLLPRLQLDDGTRTTLRNFVPVFIGRGSAQISAYIDQILASYLGATIVAASFNAQTLYTLPVSLFGMSISAAELPEMASSGGDQAARAEHVRKRLDGALRRVTFFVVPSAIAFVAIGGPIVALLFQSGRFTDEDVRIVWIILAGSALGLVASTQGRVLASAFYALEQPRIPLYAALVRFTLAAALGIALVFPIRDAAGYSVAWAAFALTAASSAGAWVELLILRAALARRIGGVPMPVGLTLVALAAAAAAGAAGWGAGRVLDLHGWRAALVAIPTFGGVYFAAMGAAKVPEARGVVRRILRR
ncbi:MAG: murein biosynthesis integral membrane protein MurJ [Deltaproteobacteria bacterium]|nr:murein biosynthesis integral membrane protein MurJ [Deltaproteobacteria bacterium]